MNPQLSHTVGNRKKSFSNAPGRGRTYAWELRTPRFLGYAGFPLAHHRTLFLSDGRRIGKAALFFQTCIATTPVAFEAPCGIRGWITGTASFKPAHAGQGAPRLYGCGMGPTLLWRRAVPPSAGPEHPAGLAARCGFSERIDGGPGRRRLACRRCGSRLDGGVRYLRRARHRGFLLRLVG